jgi:hypothetical protein
MAVFRDPNRVGEERPDSAGSIGFSARVGIERLFPGGVLLLPSLFSESAWKPVAVLFTPVLLN